VASLAKQLAVLLLGHALATLLYYGAHFGPPNVLPYFSPKQREFTKISGTLSKNQRGISVRPYPFLPHPSPKDPLL